MFDRFTERARRVMSLARWHAQRFRNDYIGTEHILLGLVTEGEGLAYQALANLGVHPVRVQAEVERIADPGEHEIKGSRLPFTPRAKRVLEEALEEAQELGHAYIGTEHLLLGVLREAEGPGAHVLLGLGLTIEATRKELLRLVAIAATSAPSRRLPVEPPRGGKVAALLRLARLKKSPPPEPDRGWDSPRFNRFTERARKVMTMALHEARNLENDYIGTEHLLLGLLREGSGVAAQVLRSLDVDLQRVRSEVEKIVEPGAGAFRGPTLPLTPRAEKVLHLAHEEARNLGHSYIGTEHLLLGLIGESDGPAAHVLQNLSVTPERIRHEVVDLLGPGGSADPGGAEPAGPVPDLAFLRRPAHEAIPALLSDAVARSLLDGADSVECRHVLAALLAAGDPGADALFRAMGIDPAEAAERLGLRREGRLREADEGESNVGPRENPGGGP